MGMRGGHMAAGRISENLKQQCCCVVREIIYLENLEAGAGGWGERGGMKEYFNYPDFFICRKPPILSYLHAFIDLGSSS